MKHTKARAANEQCGLFLFCNQKHRTSSRSGNPPNAFCVNPSPYFIRQNHTCFIEK